MTLGDHSRRVLIRLAKDRHLLLVRKPRLAHLPSYPGGQSLKQSLVRKYRGRSSVFALSTDQFNLRHEIQLKDASALVRRFGEDNPADFYPLALLVRNETLTQAIEPTANQ